ncbi:MAG TPA: DUF3473 domain-containing protein [Phycisphaerae bacterium]|nr:DUF3473 domain-containing protein [Phycisphaerae bacterium]HRR87455.1 DUF3473 domain-containing protein [Phycisphaerae bacterium]
MLNALTVDLEDWPQAVLDPSLPITDRVVGNVDRLLGLLDRHSVRATFFALGKVCERHPQLLPLIQSAGHEIASHGYGHELMYRLTPRQFEEDVRRSIEIIGSQTGRRPLGYRAPAFSITRESLWGGPILASLGFRYSSSIFPIRKARYGIHDAPRIPHRWSNCDLVEFPLTTLRVFGCHVPVCGGGYMRLLPWWVHAHAIGSMNAGGHPAVVYLHPYELASDEVDLFRRAGLRFSTSRRVMQSLWRSRVLPRLTRLFEAFRFAPITQVFEAINLPGLCPAAPGTVPELSPPCLSLVPPPTCTAT